MKMPSKKVILVEDNPADAELTRLAYRDLPGKTELVHCFDGESFFSLLPSLSLNDIQYILLDLNMPRMSGLDVLKKLQADEDWRRLPVIVLTSSMHTPDVVASYDLGANAYVVKPLDLAEFDRAVQAIDQFWGKVNLRPFFSRSQWQ